MHHNGRRNTNMKKLRLLAMVMVLLLTYVSALADSSGTNGLEKVPEAISTYVSNSRWNVWEITGWVNPGGIHTSSACAFAVVKNGSKNDLLAFGWKEDGWVYKWHNAAALPQVEDPILLCKLEQDTGFMSYYVVNKEIMETCCIWAPKGDGTWHLMHLYNYYPFMFYDTSAKNALRLYNTGWTDRDIDVWVYGTYQTELRYFSIAAFPKTVKEAREKLSNPPKIPSGTLSAKKIQFTSGKKYEVYQGPGEEYGRAGNGKALVSTNDWIQVFGEENGWIMIQYDITSDHMRIGWITADALPQKAKVDELAFSPVMAVAANKVCMTDDPLYSQASIATLKQDTNVNWLAAMGEWAYIESVGVQPIRGFVQIDDLAVK